MKIHPAVRKIILICTILAILTVAWISISGGINQIPRSRTIGQIVETIIQIACGFLSLLMIVTCFTWLKLRHPVRIAWIVSLIATAALSSIVWGPPMLVVAAAFAVLAFLAARTIIWLLGIGGA